LGSGDGIEFESFSEVAIFLALAALSFEHIAGHIPVSNSFELSPYLSLLKYRSAYEYGVYNETNRVNEQFAATIGLELNKYFRRFLLSPYVETSMGYKDQKFQLNTGVSFGIFFAR
jgi:hypothetical protein